MKKVCFCVAMTILACGTRAGWWPFGSGGDQDRPRLSELMEQASLLIDEASDLAADGKVSESVEKYRAALDELDRVERENPDRAASGEFASLRNKRAYVNAAIDSMLLSQVKSNAKVVAVSDTTALEKRLAEERKRVKGEGKKVKVKGGGEDGVKGEGKKVKVKGGGEDGVKVKGEGEEKNSTVQPPASNLQPKDHLTPAPTPHQPLSRRQLAMKSIVSGDYAAAERIISEMLVEKPNGATPLNLRAMMETRQGKFKEAERTLDQAIMSNPRSYYAYYNMADLIIKMNPSGKIAAKRYYETGRAMGGPVDEKLEAALK